MYFFNIFEIVLGLYLLYAAVTGKGKYYENEFCKVPREQYVKVMRIFAWCVGVLIMVSPILQLTGVITETSPWGWILWCVNMLGIIGMLIANVKMTDREKAKAAQGRTPSKPAGKDVSAAFVFDEDDGKPEKKA